VNPDSANLSSLASVAIRRKRRGRLRLNLGRLPHRPPLARSRWAASYISSSSSSEDRRSVPRGERAARARPRAPTSIRIVDAEAFRPSLERKIIAAAGPLARRLSNRLLAPVVC
jgi:hypothetical protein